MVNWQFIKERIDQTYTNAKKRKAAMDNNKAKYTDGSQGKNAGGTVADVTEIWDIFHNKSATKRFEKALSQQRASDKSAKGHNTKYDKPLKDPKTRRRLGLSKLGKNKLKEETKKSESLAKLSKENEQDKKIPNSLASYRERIAKRRYAAMNKEVKKEEMENIFEIMRGRFNRYYGNPDRKSMHGVMPAAKQPEKPKDTFDVQKGIDAAKARLKAKGKLKEDEQLDELSKDLLDRAAKKAYHKHTVATEKAARSWVGTKKFDKARDESGKKYKQWAKFKVASDSKNEETMNPNEEQFRLNLIKHILKEAVFHRAKKGGGGKKGQAGAKGQDTEGDNHPINIARKAVGLGFGVHLHHHNKEKTHVTPQMGHHILNHYDSLTKPHEKEEMVHHLWASPEHLQGYLGGNKKELGAKKAWHPGDAIPEKSKKNLKKYGLPSK